MMVRSLSFALMCMVMCIGGLTLSASGNAQDTGIKIAVVEMQAIQQRALAWQDLNAKLRAAQQSVVAEFQPRQQELEAEALELQQQQAILSQEAFQAKLTDFEARRRVLFEESNARQLQVQEAFANASKEIISKIREVIVEITRERGYQLILDQSASDPTIISASSDIMITDEVVKRLDAALPSSQFVLQPPQ